ncbi:MAG: hypothetical protein LBP20_03105 [Treponema sp.]|nr:hypothetical protein [Treponema sp.]
MWVKFSFYMREQVNEKLLQRQTGHKTLVMLDHYSGHRLVGDREKIREAQIETFGGLLPDVTGTVMEAGA